MKPQDYQALSYDQALPLLHQEWQPQGATERLLVENFAFVLAMHDTRAIDQAHKTLYRAQAIRKATKPEDIHAFLMAWDKK